MHAKSRLVAALAALGLAGCTQGQQPSVEAPPTRPAFPAGSVMSEIAASGRIRIGVRYDVPGVGYLNPASGEPEGFEVDLAKLIAHDMGVDPRFVDAGPDPSGLLSSGSADMVLALLGPGAASRASLSAPYFSAAGRLLVQRGPVAAGRASFNAAGARVCSAGGPAPPLDPGAILQQAGSFADCFQRLGSGQADAWAADDLVLAGFAGTSPRRFMLAGPSLWQEPLSVGVAKGKEDFTSFIDGLLSTAKHDGTWRRYYEKWIKPVTGEDPSPPPDA